MLKLSGKFNNHFFSNSHFDLLTKSSIIVFIISIVFLSPIYFYDSGLPQPGHIFMFFCASVIVFLNLRTVVSFLKHNKNMILLLLWIVSVNSFYALYLSDAIFLINTLYWIYGFFILLSIRLFVEDKIYHSLTTYLIALSFVVIELCYLFGFGNYLFWPRYDYYFNAPNQLAYYAICMFSIFFLLNRGVTDRKFYLVYICFIFIIISTGGRSSYFGLLVFLSILFYLQRRDLLKLAILIAIPVIINASYFVLKLPNYMPSKEGKVVVQNYSTKFFDSSVLDVSSYTFKRFNSITQNVESNDDSRTINNQLLTRGYKRVIDFSEYLFLGAGQGLDSRFGKFKGDAYEIHSSLFAVLFYYGFVGFILFCRFVKDLFLDKSNMIFLMPAFGYGLFTYGLRSPYFWVMLAFISALPKIKTVDS
jgi:hypothetical protein